MPRLVGLDVDSAKAAIEGLGLAGIQVITTEKASTKPLGTILSQDPGRGATLDGSSIVYLYVAAAPPTPGFDDGTWLVGKQIKPGTYRLADSGNNCYWARLKDFKGGFNSILANNNVSVPTVVTILSTDTGFESDGCGHWTADLSPILHDKNSIPEGTWIVGTDIMPGTYTVDAKRNCYWARLRNFTGGFNSIISNDLPRGHAIVTISASDVGFENGGCGIWTRS